MSFRLANVAGRAALVDGDQYFDLETVSDGAIGSDPMAAVAAFEQLHGIDTGGVEPTGNLADVELGPPVPTPKHCFGIGLNYRSHVTETAMELPTVPVVFTKFPGCISAPNTDVVLVGDAIDYEAELVVVLGRGGADIPAAKAWSHIAGVTAGQDISDRTLQFAAKPAHFDLGKSRDTYGPIGPVLVSPDCLADPDDVALQCSVNGEVRQHASTEQLIFSVPALVEYLSAVMTLYSGDVIFTGTPEGVGMASGKLLVPGDVIVTTITGVGTMTNHCVASR